MTTDLKSRIGVDLNRRIALEPGIEWAIANEVRFLDLCLDPDPELLVGRHARLAKTRDRLEESGVTLGLHTLSAVNIAETSPFVSNAADAYLAAYIDAARELGAGWVIVHAGYHFGDKAVRLQAGLERLKRAVDLAEKAGVTLLLENVNPEPDGAEVQYLGHDLEECHYFFDRLQSPHLRWSYTVNHAHMLPEGIEGFLEQMDLSRCSEVRLADNRGEIEEHLFPGKGTIDFPSMFALFEQHGYRGHFMQDYGSLEDMIRGRNVLVAGAAAKPHSPVRAR